MKRFDNYLIATDLDGTLYKNQNEIPKQNIEAIRRYISLGGKFTVATGRAVISARRIIEGIDINCPVITCNGHILFDYDKDEIVDSIDLPEDIKDYAKKIYDKFPDAGIEAFNGKDIMIIRANDVVRRHLSYEKVDIVDVPFDIAAEKPWQKLLITDEEDGIKAIREYAKTIKPDSINILDTNRLFMEAGAIGVDKGSALLSLADHVGADRDKTFAIGNYYNDCEMINAAYLGACVADTPDDIKEMCGYVTKLTCSEGGFAEFVDFVMNMC
ncbi:MAG: Cof-type HAD-IIB family hydrolase [Clostridia bacterium]|nr:Cof-type HAD-IIB family hydrolase [Clostridia bacterium]